jgi:hypothetical protein
MSESIRIVDEIENLSKYSKGEKLYEHFLFDLRSRRYLNGCHGLEENPFIRWSKLSEEERLSWEYIVELKL